MTMTDNAADRLSSASTGNAAIGVAISGGASRELINVNLFAHIAA